MEYKISAVKIYGYEEEGVLITNASEEIFDNAHHLSNEEYTDEEIRDIEDDGEAYILAVRDAIRKQGYKADYYWYGFHADFNFGWGG